MKSVITCSTQWNDLYLTSGIPFWIVDYDGKDVFAFPERLHHALNPDIFSFSINEMSKHQIRDEVLVYFLSDYYYLVLCRLDNSYFFLSAPLSTEQHVQIPLNYIRHFVISEEKSAFMTLLSCTPPKQVYQTSRFVNLVKHTYCGGRVGDMKIRSINSSGPSVEDSLAQTVQRFPSVYRTSASVSKDDGMSIDQTLISPLTDTGTPFINTSPDSKAPVTDTSPDSKTSIASMMQFSSAIPEVAETMQHQSLYFEEDIANAVMAGDDLEFVRQYHRPMNFEFGRMSESSLQQQRYLFIIVLYAISHAAIKGGMDPESAFRLSDSYCRKMDRLNSIHEIIELCTLAGIDYCKQVRQAKGQTPLSSEVRKCCEYIYTHIYEPIRLKDLEPVANMNRRSLTIHFKEEIGETIPQFVLHKKIEEARYLITSSDFSFLQISTLLGFSSQSLFIEHFKAQYGMTPKQYRCLQTIPES